MSRDVAMPLRAVDRVWTTAGGFAAAKTVDAADPYLAGHYPGLPIYPGVFVIETVLQAAYGAVRERYGPAVVATVAAVSSVHFSASLAPGDELRVDCAWVDAAGPDLVGVRATASRPDGVAAARLSLELRLSRGRPDAGAR